MKGDLPGGDGDDISSVPPVEQNQIPEGRPDNGLTDPAFPGDDKELSDPGPRISPGIHLVDNVVGKQIFGKKTEIGGGGRRR